MIRKHHLFSILVMFITSLLFFTGCKCNKEIVKTDTIYKSVKEIEYRDRIDSVYIDKYRDVYINGDTVRETVVDVKYIYKSRTDTIHQHDTVYQKEYVDKVVEKEVVKPAYWPIWVFLGLVALIAALVIYIKKKFNIKLI